MKTIIIEDEKHARDHLERMLLEIDASIEVQAKLDSVSGAVEWLQQHQTDLIFLDIHLSDDLSFRIFEQVQVKTPIIFTTAYDQYAIRAFKVNSIDYLLKPIDRADLSRAIEKYQNLQAESLPVDYAELLETLNNGQAKSYQERFLVNRGEKILSIPTAEIAYFEGEDRYVFLHTREGSRYIVNYRLGDLEDALDPKQWFRLNRSFVSSFDAIDKIISLSKSRIKVELRPQAKRDIFVSSANTRIFKEWLNR